MARPKVSRDAARQGFNGILSSGYYLDLMQPASEHYAVDPMKDAAANLKPDERKRILGGEAAMWEEIASTENVESRIWPRLAAIAERLWSAEYVTDVESMYARLEATSRWLELKGMRHQQELELMLARLAGSFDVHPLAIFASVLEPIKGYRRHESRPYGFSTPLNRLVDAVSPESDESRKLRDAVDRFLRLKSEADAVCIRERLTVWQRNVPNVFPILESNSVLAENVSNARAVGDLCALGLDALQSIQSRKATPRSHLSENLKAVDMFAGPRAELLIQFAPGIRKLVEASAQP